MMEIRKRSKEEKQIDKFFLNEKKTNVWIDKKLKNNEGHSFWGNRKKIESWVQKKRYEINEQVKKEELLKQERASQREKNKKLKYEAVTQCLFELDNLIKQEDGLFAFIATSLIKEDKHDSYGTGAWSYGLYDKDLNLISSNLYCLNHTSTIELRLLAIKDLLDSYKGNEFINIINSDGWVNRKVNYFGKQNLQNETHGGHLKSIRKHNGRYKSYYLKHIQSHRCIAELKKKAQTELHDFIEEVGFDSIENEMSNFFGYI